MSHPSRICKSTNLAHLADIGLKTHKDALFPEGAFANHLIDRFGYLWVGSNLFHSVQLRPRLRPNDAIRYQAVVALERPNRGFSFRTEGAVDSQAKLRL